MRWKAKEAICTDGTVWIVRDFWHPYEYRACANEREAAALAAKLNEATQKMGFEVAE
jgi:hypothetical protein